MPAPPVDKGLETLLEFDFVVTLNKEVQIFRQSEDFGNTLNCELILENQNSWWELTRSLELGYWKLNGLEGCLFSFLPVPGPHI